jgi:hypothetical protein
VPENIQYPTNLLLEEFLARYWPRKRKPLRKAHLMDIPSAMSDVLRRAPAARIVARRCGNTKCRTPPSCTTKLALSAYFVWTFSRVLWLSLSCFPLLEVFKKRGGVFYISNFSSPLGCYRSGAATSHPCNEWLGHRSTDLPQTRVWAIVIKMAIIWRARLKVPLGPRCPGSGYGYCI